MTAATQEEAAAAYDMAAIEYRGLNAVTNFDLSRYIRWLRPGLTTSTYTDTDSTLSASVEAAGTADSQFSDGLHLGQGANQQRHSMWPSQSPGPHLQERPPVAPTALSLLLQSSLLKQMLERGSAAAATDYESNTTEPSQESDSSCPPEQQQHHLRHQQLDSNNLPAIYHDQGANKHASYQHHTLSLVDDDEGTVYHEHEISNPYQQSGVTSTYHGAVRSHYAELEEQLTGGLYQELHQQQQQMQLQQHRDHLAAEPAYGHGPVHVHGGCSGTHCADLSAIYSELESGAASGSLEDGSWVFPGALPQSNIISTC